MCYYLFLSLMNALFYVDIFVFQTSSSFNKIGSKTKKFYERTIFVWVPFIYSVTPYNNVVNFQSSHLYQIKRMYGLWFVIVILICDCNFGKQTSFGSPPDSEDDIDIQSYLDVNIFNNFKISGEKWVCGKKITDMYPYNLWKFSKNDLLVDLLFPLEREQLQMNKFCWVLSVKR